MICFHEYKSYTFKEIIQPKMKHHPHVAPNQYYILTELDILNFSSNLFHTMKVHSEQGQAPESTKSNFGLFFTQSYCMTSEDLIANKSSGYCYGT